MRAPGRAWVGSGVPGTCICGRVMGVRARNECSLCDFKMTVTEKLALFGFAGEVVWTGVYCLLWKMCP